MSHLLTVGVDVGGTKIETALIDPHGEIVASYRSASGFGMDVDAWIRDVQDAVANLCEGISYRQIGALGVGFAGQVDPASGVVNESPNIGWRSVPLRSRLEEAMGRPVMLVNDVQSATWAEWKRGAGQGTAHMACIFVGTGVGGGIIFDGNLYKGATGSAGEIGHTVVDLDGPPCKCGAKGCLEAYAGGWAIALRLQDAIRSQADEGKRLLEIAGGESGSLTAETLSQGAQEGDPLAQRLVQQVGEDLGVGVVSVVNMLNPEVVVIGGGVIDGIPQFVEIVRRVVEDRALGAATASLSIRKAQLANYAPVIGAGLLGRELL